MYRNLSSSLAQDAVVNASLSFSGDNSTVLLSGWSLLKGTDVCTSIYNCNERARGLDYRVPVFPSLTVLEESLELRSSLQLTLCNIQQTIFC